MTHRQYIRNAAAWLATFAVGSLLIGCGGGGSSGAGGFSNNPTTASTTTTTAPAVATFIATDTYTMQIPASSASDYSLTFTGPATISATSSTVAMGLDATGHPVSAVVSGAATLGPYSLLSGEIAFAGTGFTSLFRGDLYGSQISTTATDTLPKLHYSNFGEWQLLLPASTTGTYKIQQFAGGTQLTSLAGMPATGTITYPSLTGMSSAIGFNGNSLHTYWLGDNTGTGLTVNFALKTFTGSVLKTLGVMDLMTSTFGGDFNSLSMSGTISGNTFSGTITTVADTTVDTSNLLAMPGNINGLLSGTFYGPAANEVTGVFILTAVTTNGPVTIIGSFGAKQ